MPISEKMKYTNEQIGQQEQKEHKNKEKIMQN
jgi:hypothetical protein